MSSTCHAQPGNSAAHSALPAASAFTDALLDAVVDGVIVIDHRGAIKAFNRSACDIFGYGADAVLGRNISILMDDADASDHDRHMARYQAGGHARIIGIGRELKGKRSDGTVFPMHLSVGEYNHDGHRYFVGICRDISTMRQAEHRLQQLALYDALTGCANRAFLNDQLEYALAGARRTSPRQPLAVLFLDLDRFKHINDHFGHRIGDGVLKLASQRIRPFLSSGDLLARVGSDEFAIIVTHASQERVHSLCRQVVDALAKPFDLCQRTVRTGASVGVSRFPEDGSETEQLLRFADMAMQRAKTGGGSQFAFFSPKLHQEMRYHALLGSQLRETLGSAHYELHYQLQFRLDTLEISGLEALLRWRNAQGQLVPPDEFLPIAAEQGLMPEIGQWVVERACLDNKLLRDRKLLSVPVSVNISTHEMESPHFVQKIEHVLAATGLRGTALELELTEHTAVSNIQRTREVMEHARAMGIKLALDDFGTGFSSLSYLKRFPFDRLKIDRSFIGALPDCPEDAALTRAILQIAANLGLSVVAEGVETREQRDFLLRHGCAHGQGYWLARPMAMPDLIARLGYPASPPPPSREGD